LILGDGSRRGDSVCYWTKSERLADDVQELALRCGYAASKSLTPGRDIYRVNLRSPVEAKLVEPERLPYAGKVYCVSRGTFLNFLRRRIKKFKNVPGLSFSGPAGLSLSL
jgi:UDP-glucuronate decarboxylase